MFGFNYNFYDSYGNFDNRAFIALLAKAKRESCKPEKKEKKSYSYEINIFNSVSKKELRSFINKFSIFINSGIDIKATLNILIKQTKKPYLKKIVIEMKENIDHGVTISETMSRYPKVFDPLIISLISVGEKTGQLGKILIELDDNLLESIELRSRVTSSMIYPIILLTMTVIMVIFMMIYIVPKITEAFLTTGVELPALTKLVVNISTFIKNDWYIMVFIILGIYGLYRLIYLNYIGRMFFAIIRTKFPIFGHIVKQSNIIYFIRSFTILLDSGVLLLESLKTSSNVVTNLAYKRELIRVKNEVELGLTISKSLGLNNDYGEAVYINPYFPEDFAFVVSTGEETGSLSNSLKKIGQNYNLELKRYIGNLSTMMEPIIIIIVGALVGTIVIAIMLPFFQIGKVVQGM